MKHTQNAIKSDAKEFDTIMCQLIPQYMWMIRTMVDAIPFEKAKPIKVLNLGHRDATETRVIAEAFPNASFSCLDMLPRMIVMPKTIEDMENILGRPGESTSAFSKYEFPFGRDVVVSPFAFHQLLNNAERLFMYQKIFDSLRNGGCFINIDEVLGPTQYIDRLYVSRWTEFMRKTASEDTIRSELLKREKTLKNLATLDDNINYIKDVGFENIEVICKYFGYVIYFCMKPS